MGLTKEEIKNIIKKRLNYQIQNIVAKADLGVKVPLKNFYEFLRRNIKKYNPEAIVNYNPERFPGLIIKKILLVDKHRISVLVFSSGKMVITGAKDEKHVHQAVEIVKKMLEDFGIKFESEPLTSIQNIVAKGELGVPLDLEQLVFDLENAIYEPEQFPGVIHRIEIPEEDKVFTYLLFNTGRFVCTGVRTIEELPRAIELLVDEIAEVLEKEGYTEETEEEIEDILKEIEEKRKKEEEEEEKITFRF